MAHALSDNLPVDTLPFVAPMTLDDLDSVDALERRCFTTPWTRAMYENELKHNLFSHFLAIRAHTTPATSTLPDLLAYSGYWLLGDEAHIVTLASHPDFRGCGLGKWMLLASIESAYELSADLITLEVRESNKIAQALYRNHGFVDVGRRRNYYPPSKQAPGEDALLLTFANLQEAFEHGTFDEAIVRAQRRVLEAIEC